MRVVLMATAPFAVPSLQAIAGHKELELALVVTQPDRPSGRGHKIRFTGLKQAALEAGCTLYQPENVNTRESLERIRQAEPDVLVVVAYGQILNESLLALPRLGAINLHGSLLPAYRGAAPVHRAVMDGVRTTGVCTMHMVRALDAGDVIHCTEVPVGPDMTAGDVYDRLAQQGSGLLVRTLLELDRGEAPRTPQNHAEATYAPSIRKEEQRVDWSKDNSALHNFVRGLQPWPGAITRFRGQPFKILETETVEDDFGPGEPGTIVQADPRKGLVVRTGHGALKLVRVKPAGKKAMAARDFLNGVNISEGEPFDGEEE